MPYSPPRNSQIDGSADQYNNCVPATCVMAADRATVGRKRVTTRQIRAASGISGRGLTYAEAVAATKKVTGVQGEPRYGITRADLHNLVVAGHAVTLSIDCSVTRYTAYRTNTFAGSHSVYVNSYHSSTYRIEDPGTTSAGYLDWPADLVYRAAEARTMGHGINVIVWPDTEGEKRKAIAPGRFRATPSLTGVDKGPIDVGYIYYVGATTNGGAWKRSDGGISNGWHRISTGAFVPGKGLA
jgi:hypothetical protein